MGATSEQNYVLDPTFDNMITLPDGTPSLDAERTQARKLLAKGWSRDNLVEYLEFCEALPFWRSKINIIPTKKKQSSPPF